MNKEEWLLYRELAVNRGVQAVNKAFDFYCNEKGIKPTSREMRVVEQYISVDDLITWVDVKLNVTIIKDKNGFPIGAF